MHSQMAADFIWLVCHQQQKHSKNWQKGDS